MDYKSDFLTKNIITYLGNKRKLLKFINDSIAELCNNDEILSKKELKDIRVFDIFSGSGIVSRSLKQYGYTVYSNDLEIYTKAINKAFIETNKEDLEEIFKGIYEDLINYYESNQIKFKKSTATTDYEKVIDILNSVRDLGDKQTNPYFSLYYAPKDTANPNFETERLFYTQENARFIDSVLDAVFEFKNNAGNLIFNEESRSIILASLFNKMTTNINTSGTMKGFHNGWGGKGAHALERIMGNMKLEVLDLLENAPRGMNFNNYAENIFINNPQLEVDVIYADPPYNQHQYSANYHLLTTAMNNRDYDVGEVRNGARAGIRTDHNRSDFSKSKKNEVEGYEEKVSAAYVAFDNFIKNTEDKTKYIVISYNQEGVLSHEELIDILSQDGKNSVEVKIQKHEKYKGGKNTNLSNFVIEYLFVVKTNVTQTEEEKSLLKEMVSLETRLTLLVDKYINISKANNKEGIKVESKEEDFKIYFNDSDKYLIVDKNYKVIESNLDIDLSTIKKMELLEEVFYQDFEKEELINDYIESGNYTSAIKVISSFKITKHKEKFLNFINILESKELSEVNKSELEKVKLHIK